MLGNASVVLRVTNSAM